MAFLYHHFLTSFTKNSLLHNSFGAEFAETSASTGTSRLVFRQFNALTCYNFIKFYIENPAGHIIVKPSSILLSLPFFLDCVNSQVPKSPKLLNFETNGYRPVIKRYREGWFYPSLPISIFSAVSSSKRYCESLSISLATHHSPAAALCYKPSIKDWALPLQ